MAKKKAKAPEKEENADPAETVAVNDAWTGMLVISFLALSIGTGFVAYEYFVRYDGGKEPDKVPKFSAPPPAVQPAVPKPPDPPKADDKKDDDKKVTRPLPLGTGVARADVKEARWVNPFVSRPVHSPDDRIS